MRWIISKKFSFIFSLLVFAILFSFIGCTDLLAPKTQTDISLNIDLSKIIKSSRNDGTSQGSSSLGDNPTIKVAVYDAKDYNKTTNSTENLTLITQAQSNVGEDGIARVKLSDIPVGIDAIVFAELLFSDGDTAQVFYAGNSDVFKVKPTDNKVSLLLKKVNNDTPSGSEPNVPDLSFNYEFTLMNEARQEIEDENQATYSVTDNQYATITVVSPEASDKVWSYLIESKDFSFIAGQNYTVSVDLKADKKTVVAIAAAEADMFFTVGTEWKTYTFETGYLKANSQNGISIGTGLSSKVDISNLVVSESNVLSNLPALSFYVEKDGINTYLNNNPTNDIIKVEKTYSSNIESGYKLTLNSTEVSLQLRDYLSETGLHKASFNMNSTNPNLNTSISAKTTSSEQFANGWNSESAIGNGEKSCNVFIPVYNANEEYIIEGILKGGQTAGEVIEISNYKIEKVQTLDNTGKVFAICANNSWYQSTTLPFTEQVIIQPVEKIDCQVILTDSFSGASPSDSNWNECTRFINPTYDSDNFKVTQDKENFTITNNYEETLTLNITLGEDCKIVIEEADGILVSSWKQLQNKLSQLGSTASETKFVITNDLDATGTIEVTKPVKITASNNVTISRGEDFTGVFFVVKDYESDKGRLELGSEDAIITLDGKNSATDPLLWIYREGISLTLTNCILQNNPLFNTDNGYGNGGAVKVESNFTMNNSSIQNCSANVNGGAVYIFNGGSFTMNGGSISECSAGSDGGAVYICHPGSFTMNDGTISQCYATNFGGGVYVSSGGTSMKVSGSATIQNNVCVGENCGASIYNGGGTVTVGNETISSTDITQNIINGEIEASYAAGLTYANDTLYISNAQGLATFRDIVNGTLTDDIKVAKNTSVSGAFDETFSKLTQYSTINAELVSDIDLSDIVNWTPIGNSSSEKTYKGSFDGKKYAISNLTIDTTDNTTDTNPIGLFGAIEGGTVKNLVVQGSIKSSYYTGGITGYLNGGTIENCVNNVEITNSAINGTGGIVGYVSTGGGTIQNCINLVSITGGNSVGGIVGGAGPSSLPTIKKCINIGDINASNVNNSGIASGIYGYATTNSSSSSSSSSILDCINLGSINGSYACGIVYNYGGYTSVSNCINIGSLTGTFVYAIANSSSGTYSNNYYDSTKITIDDKAGIKGKATSELIALNSTDLSDQWSFTEGRYPLPKIAESIPEQIWETVEAAAIPDSSSVSGGGISNYTDTDGISITDTLLTKTSLVTVISQETTINCSDEGAGVFKLYYGGTVTLSPFAIGQYEVTQGLYKAVMDSNPSYFTSDNLTSGENQELRPVDSVNWYQAVAFCNELTKQTMGESYCVYYTDSSYSTEYTTNDASDEKLPYFNQSKKGYRLPTEAEWEFAARGGDETELDWVYAYPGVQSDSSLGLEVLCPYAWFKYLNSSYSTNDKTHEVGLKKANHLSLYDMAGNVQEWCWDYYIKTTTETLDSIVKNPTGYEPDSSNSNRAVRGGYWDTVDTYCYSTYRDGYGPAPTSPWTLNTLGFRICRSL